MQTQPQNSRVGPDARLLVLNNVFFKKSETFIYRQVLCLLKEFHVTLVAFKFDNDAVFPVGADRITIPIKTGIANRILSKSLRLILNARLGFGALGQVFLFRLLKRNFSIVHAHYGWTALNVLSLAKRSGVPLVVSFHGKDASADLRERSYRDALPELFDYASAVIICSPHMINTLSLHKWLSKVHVIPYGIDTREFVVNLDKRRGEKKKIQILHVGRLVAKKGVPDLIRVFSKLSRHRADVELHIIGEGPQETECRALAREVMADSIQFHGALPIDRVRDFMQEADVYVLNSRTDDTGDMEGLPNAILEAMSCGVPVVSTNHAGIPMAIIDKETGLLVEERDNAGLYSALMTLCDDSELRGRLGRNGRQKVCADFSMEKMESGLHSVFADVLRLPNAVSVS